MMDKSNSTNGLAALNRSTTTNGTPTSATALSNPGLLPVVGRRSSRHDRSSIASSAHGSIYEGAVKEYIWARELDENTPIEFNFRDEDGDSDYLWHSLCLRHIILDSKADDSDHVVWIETLGHDETKISTAIARMKRGLKEMCELDLNFHSSVKFHLAEGSGPVQLVGQHVTEFPRELNLNDTEVETDEDEIVSLEEESEANKSRESGEESKKTNKSLKRKAPEPKIKRGRLDPKMEVEEEEEDSDEDEDDADYVEDEEMEEDSSEDEDAEVGEEEEEEDSDEDSDDESEESEESDESPQRIIVVKKTGKKKQKTLKTQDMNTSASRKIKTTPKQTQVKGATKKGRKVKKAVVG